MADIFDNQILCKDCNSRMKKETLEKDGFLMRAVVCGKCGHKIFHPNDEQEYSKFISLRNKEFRVKMRLVGNSYAVSIPKEIVSFIREQEKIMDDMVRLCFEDLGKLTLNFSEQIKGQKDKTSPMFGSKETISPIKDIVELEQIKKNKKENKNSGEFS